MIGGPSLIILDNGRLLPEGTRGSGRDFKLVHHSFIVRLVKLELALFLQKKAKHRVSISQTKN